MFVTDYTKHLLDNVKKIHFIGCGGSGMYPLIQILNAKGYVISGSDVLDGSIIQYEREMGVTFLVYCVALICEAVTREPLVSDLLNSMIVIAIGITQAFLFTYSLIALLDIGFFTKATACRETLVIAITTVAAFALFFLFPQSSRALIFYGFSLWYMLLMARYVALFRRYYKR